MTWNGNAGDGLIATAGNWNPSQSPVSGDLLIFSGTNSLLPQLSSGLTVGSLTFDNTAGAFTLGGAETYTINASGITNNSTSAETITTRSLWARRKPGALVPAILPLAATSPTAAAQMRARLESSAAQAA